MEFTEESISKYNTKVKTLDLRRSQLMERTEAFNLENFDLIESIRLDGEYLAEDKKLLSELAKHEYIKTGEKQLIGGLGIRVGTKLVYDDAEALAWGYRHELCLSLDRRAFEKLGVEQDFVRKEEKITVTFPQNGGRKE